MRDEKHECKENESYEDEGNYESFQLIKKLQGDVEKVCAMCENLQKDSVCTKVRHEALVESLKEELCRAMHNCEDEHHLEVEVMMKNVEKEFYLDFREELFEGRKKVAEAKETVDVMTMKEREEETKHEKDMKFEGSEDDEESEENIESDDDTENKEMEESEEENEIKEEYENENEDLLSRLLYG